MTSSSPIPGFTPLSPTIHLYQPPSPTLTHHTSPNPPQLIILCTWTSAKPAHIAKYTTAYQSLHPTTPILLITTHITDLIIHSIPHKAKSLLPALTYLLSLPATTPGPYFSPFSPPTARLPPGSILLHTFSEGGSFAAVSLATTYLHYSKQKLPVGAFIFDSTPGSPTPSFASSTAAFARTLPGFCQHNVIRKSVGGVVYLSFRARSGNRDKGRRDWLHFTQLGLNNERLWDSSSESVPTTYLFSEKDDLVLWEDVQNHAVRAKRRSLMVRFKETGHCGHVMREREKGIYWAAVRLTWEGVRVDGGLGVKLHGLRGTTVGWNNRKGWLSLDSLCLEVEEEEEEEERTRT
ncbi:hypothetical protein QC764_503200 [Podospora pseudoanserina]|uniref:Uncharacterized protein n=1 Tax=Podospora pseudoanserina TaxID=2609844 RepID=A0ABR0I5A5_9PEZI|nr:hypothetical protein QC764_503200 [Podospora pseudoanserina]